MLHCISTLSVFSIINTRRTGDIWATNLYQLRQVETWFSSPPSARKAPRLLLQLRGRALFTRLLFLQDRRSRHRFQKSRVNKIATVVATAASVSIDWLRRNLRELASSHDFESGFLRFFSVLTQQRLCCAILLFGLWFVSGLLKGIDLWFVFDGVEACSYWRGVFAVIEYYLGERTSFRQSTQNFNTKKLMGTIILHML